jgi:hypothetical protein
LTDDLESRLRRLEDRALISETVIKYAIPTGPSVLRDAPRDPHPGLERASRRRAQMMAV